MPMPNDNDKNLSPDEEPEEKKYSFLQETIKPKPISRRQLAKQLIRIAVYGVILGAFACLGFFALKPWVQDRFRGDLHTVSIPEDDEPAEEETEVQAEEEVTDPVLDAVSYEEIMTSMNERAKEASKGIATVEPVSEAEDWASEMTGIHSGGAGIIIADNGQELLILADSSVCADASAWKVTFQDGSSYEASLKKRDQNSGLAVFSVVRSGIADSTWSAIKVSVLGNSNLVTQGDVVMALGNMFGYAEGVGYGTVSSTEYKESFYDGECDILATDIPAVSGGTGVLFNIDGEVIGMISPSIWEKDGGGVANAYAISDLKTMIEILANGESVPYIGIRGVSVTAALEEEQGLPSGVYVVDVDPESPAMAAGIQSGDVICQVGEKKVANLVTYQSAMLEIKAGQQLTIIGQRLGSDGYVDVEFTVTVGSKE